MRLLVIVSGDYGELGGALYFLQGLELAEPPQVLLPENLSDAVGSPAGMKVSTYRNLTDIERHIQGVPLDAVMLFSGYLLTIGRRYSLLNAWRLLRLLRQRGVSVLTSDPFLGLLDRPSQLDFMPVLGEGGSRVRRRLRSRALAWRLYLLRRMLHGCWHVYPSPIRRLHGDSRPRALSYFNPTGVHLDVSGAAPSGAEPASWIFVLSQVDCLMQTRVSGASFVSGVAARLMDTVRLNRRPVLVAPAALLASVRSQLPATDQVTLVCDEGYVDFMRRLMSAELAFFWNYYSFSIIHRVRALRPVMFFDEGHMVHIMPALHEAGVRLFYDDWRPPLMNLQQPLELAELNTRARQTVAQFERVAQGLRACDAPASVLQRAVSADQRNVLDARA